MKTIKTNTKLVNFKGETLKVDNKDLIIGEVISTILGGESSNPTLAWQLGKKFAIQKEVELKAEEVVFIKKEVENNKSFFAIIKGQVIEMLD